MCEEENKTSGEDKTEPQKTSEQSFEKQLREAKEKISEEKKELEKNSENSEKTEKTVENRQPEATNTSSEPEKTPTHTGRRKTAAVKASKSAETAVSEEQEEKIEQVSEKEGKPEKKINARFFIRIAVLVICIGVFGFSVIKIVSDLRDDSTTGDTITDLLDLAGRDDPSVENTDPVNNDTPDVNTEVTPDNAEITTPSDTPSGDSTEITVPDGEYDDQTHEQEQQTDNQTPVTVSRPGASLDKTDLTVIHPDDIILSDISFLKIDLTDVIAKNSDTVAWICIPGNDYIQGLPIDTAVVQTDDNEYYLSHSFDKSENVNGWIYADYRCNMEKITSNWNTVLFGHARSYKMFGGLKNLNESPEWYKNGYNHFIKITTPYDETIWQIFSWHETNVYSDYIKTSFTNAEEFITFATEMQDQNQLKGYFSKFTFTENSRILTLSTCKGSNPANRVAVHAVLVARKKLS